MTYTDLRLLPYIMLGGALGSAFRYITTIFVGGNTETFPWHTIVVNVIGCFLMGIVAELMALYWSPSAELRVFLTIGFLGGFTTFSSFALDIGYLSSRNNIIGSASYIILSVTLSITAFFFATFLIKRFY